VLENAVPMLGTSTPEQADALSSIQKLSKHVPPGALQPNDIVNVAKSIVMKAQQGQQQMQAMQAQRQAPPQPAAGAQQQPQMMPPRAA
jgi:hypothetical protein